MNRAATLVRPTEGDKAAGTATRRRLPGPLASKDLLVVLTYLLLGCLAFLPVQPFSTTRVDYCGCYDVGEQIWFLAWTPHAIFHGLNPFFTHFLNYPGGVNLASNTSMPLLGVLASPITFTLGPIASFNVLIRLALGLSAIAMYRVLRRYCTSRVACFIGGLLYGFSPYVIAQASLHLNLAFVPLLPLIVLALDDLFVRERRSARRAGLLLGLLVAAQYYVSAELLVDLCVIGAIGLILLTIRHPKAAWARRRRVLAGGGTALGVVLVLVGYPVAYTLFGAQRVQPNSTWVLGNETFRSDLLSPIIPTSSQLIGPSHLIAIGTHFLDSNYAENGIYIGLPLLAILLLTVALVRRRPEIYVSALLAVVAFVFSLGPELLVDGRSTGLELPFVLYQHIPMADLSVPARYVVFSFLFFSIVLAIGLDTIVNFAGRRIGSRGPIPWRKVAPIAIAIAIAVVVAGVALFPLIPNLPYRSPRANVPSYFTSGAVDAIPQGSVVLAYPYPINPDDEAMVWQAVAGFRFQLIGGYVLTPVQKNGPGAAGLGGGLWPPTLNPPLAQILFEHGFSGVPHGTQAPPAVPWSIAGMRQFLSRYKVQTVVVDPKIGDDPSIVTDFFTTMFDASPIRVGGVDVWYRADERRSYLHPPKKHKARRKRRTAGAGPPMGP